MLETGTIGTITPITVKGGNATYTVNIITAPDMSGGFYEIYNLDDLKTLNEIIVRTAINDVNQNAKLMNDIDLGMSRNNDNGFAGLASSGAYVGIFDGQGYSIYNLYILKSAQNTFVNVGLFCSIVGGTVKNLVIGRGSTNDGLYGNTTGTASKCYTYLGGVCGSASDATFENIITDIYVSGTTAGTGYVGGICGRTSGACTFIKCVVNNQVRGNGCNYVAGISYSGTFKQCIKKNIVYGAKYVAGISFNGKVEYCINKGQVSGGSYGAGITCQGNPIHCANYGTIGSSSYSGGIASYNVHVYECYNCGQVTCSGSTITNYAGGIVAHGGCTSSYNKGVVSAANSYAGALLGTYFNGLNYSYTTAGVGSYKYARGAFFGGVNNSSQYVHHCLSRWTPLYDSVNLIISPNLVECKYVTADELKESAEFLGEAFMDDVDNENDGFPILKFTKTEEWQWVLEHSA